MSVSNTTPLINFVAVRRIAYKISLTVLMPGIAFFAFAPLVLYSYTRSLVSEMPPKTATQLSNEDVERLWSAHETCSKTQCSSITPYWIYRWLGTALFNDYITPIDIHSTYRNISNMASHVAIYHMRQGNFKGKGMGRWHLTHMNLTIWLQRNWSSREIASKYKDLVS